MGGRDGEREMEDRERVGDGTIILYIRATADANYRRKTHSTVYEDIHSLSSYYFPIAFPRQGGPAPKTTCKMFH